MFHFRLQAGAGILLAIVATCAAAESWPLDEKPAAPGEWGFRPAEAGVSEVNPPAFVWRPQKNARQYELQLSRSRDFAPPAYEAAIPDFNCHTPPLTLEPGQWFWRFRAIDKTGAPSLWSRTRAFTIDADTTPLPMPPRGALLARIPDSHPRLFTRPEQLPQLRQAAQTNLAASYRQLAAQCDRLLKDPPSTEEPPKYPADMEKWSDPYRSIWWGNRQRTTAVLGSAATLAFTRLLDGNEEYGQLARHLLLEAAKWDPKGATGYRYNDEAGMPYAYYFSRTYTFVHDLLTEEERAICRKVMTIRGTEMYKHLCPSQLWTPYGSHRNRAWHFLGEVGIAFKDEIPEAADWLWFAMNVFYHTYPVWCDADGGWHEGMAYWSSYMNRFTTWADIMRVAMNVDAYAKPFFSRIGYYAMYLQPPGTKGGGFGDLTARRESSHNARIMQIFATQANNPYWQWYVDAHDVPAATVSYTDFVLGTHPRITPRAPTDLPSSRCFAGTGQAVLNTTLLNAADNVEIVFKSSPFGTQSHGYEANNSFLLYAFGERLFIRSGFRDMYGSEHHRDWMWHTKSTNCITVNGTGQRRHDNRSTGRITAFETSDAFDYVEGEAGSAYEKRLDRFRRGILFIKPELIVIFDSLIAPEPSTFEWRLHAPTEMRILDEQRLHAVNGEAACDVTFLHPAGLRLSQTDKFDPPPRPRIKLTEWHLTAATDTPAKSCDFITLLRPHRTGETPPRDARLIRLANGYAIEATLRDGTVIVLLRSAPDSDLAHGPVRTDAEVAAVTFDTANKPTGRFHHGGTHVRTE